MKILVPSSLLREEFAFLLHHYILLLEYGLYIKFFVYCFAHVIKHLS